ncbi:LysR family transcriptional regulator [Comamonas sp. BIGb0124]|uniref:LysR family transcriptional regulator n=1 Tax=Comamonas sp. BIGb0124 TaxID=2485130 RepID=UPI000F45F0C9|nr:LysR family transcriptional regulator [Comamonas sp. BIGb0124]ROR24877.1 LysR family transcriptional regulator [Comamonas sp. BIGb0124]
MTTTLREIDLNLLVVLRDLMQTRSISATAVRLGMSQPAASNALARLRTTYANELFVRAGNTMQPTALAMQLAAPVEEAMVLLQSTFAQREQFDPAHDTRLFNLAMTDVGEVYFMPRLIAHCARHAPFVRLKVIQTSGPTLRQDMQDGRVDLALGPFEDMPGSAYQQRLFDQSCVCLFRSDHPFASHPPTTVAEYRHARHLFVANAASPYVEIQQRMEKAGIHASRGDQVSSFLSAPFVVATSDCVVTLPFKLVEQFARPLGLVWIHPPLRLPTLSTHCFWHRRVHQDAAHAWLRAQIMALFGETRD